MMKKMIPNDMFYAHYPYRPDMEDSVILQIFSAYLQPHYQILIYCFSVTLLCQILLLNHAQFVNDEASIFLNTVLLDSP